ncbi:thiaminase II [Muribacter muris]|uniref:Aminopyrimidine aminohydrolase n=1 Tax=Muribacter muris TaxID=67855 RepID=A0A4Y9K5M2_9PAST|nr:thiaminase II [Muribacter muris]MBF0783948.1 thiaminase II [Muribacter muris]MBF0827503.1 thiaminase II [Muribacter muris]TFV13343.1 thiaminase II [Muribacter muris]
MLTCQQLIQGSSIHWKNYIEHHFVLQLAQGTLPIINFQHYLKQDYLYLFHYSRAFGLAVYKADTFAQMSAAQQVVQSILEESELHISYCKEWGISKEELQQLSEAPACIAYTRYVLDCGMHGTLAELYAAIAPCALGYAEIARMINERRLSPSNNPYQKWIDSYASPDFQHSAAQIGATLEQLCQFITPSQLQKIQEIFTTATRMEVAFWQMGLDLN